MRVIEKTSDSLLVWFAGGENLVVRDPHVSCTIGPVKMVERRVTFTRNSLASVELGPGGIVLRVLWSYPLDQAPELDQLVCWYASVAWSVPTLPNWRIKARTQAFVLQYAERHTAPFVKFRRHHAAWTPRGWSVVPATKAPGKSTFLLLSASETGHFRREFRLRRELGYSDETGLPVPGLPSVAVHGFEVPAYRPAVSAHGSLVTEHCPAASSEWPPAITQVQHTSGATA